MNTVSFREDGTAEIQMVGGYTALVDLADLELVYRYHWVPNKSGQAVYAYGYDRNTGRMISMHRVIMNPPPGMVVHHHNSDRLDNRRCNMHVCYQGENTRKNAKKRKTS